MDTSKEAFSWINRRHVTGRERLLPKEAEGASPESGERVGFNFLSKEEVVRWLAQVSRYRFALNSNTTILTSQN